MAIRRCRPASPVGGLLLRGELLHVEAVEIDRIEHQRRKAGIAHRIGDDPAGEGEQDARRFGDR